MSFEADLKSSYAHIHQRLLNPNAGAFKDDPPPKLLTRSTATLPLTRFTLPKRPKVDLYALLSWIAVQEGVHIADLTSRCRTKHLSHIRFIFYYLARKTSASSPRIAAAVGLQDHTSVLYGVKRCTILRKQDLSFGARLDAYEARLFPTTHRKDTDRVVAGVCCPYCGR